ncbi:hypothetical protein MXB_3332 [Myxobolus squamalis]|nr:hypothetical protein MXB_3332 [Myxobolus squamalis]
MTSPDMNFLRCTGSWKINKVAYDRSTNLFMLCVWALLTSKSEYFYCEILCLVVELLDYNWIPSVYIVDFEKALINAVRYQFTEIVLLESINILTLIKFKEIEKAIAVVKTKFELESNN